MIKKLLAKKRKVKFATAQLKVTVILVYYTILGVMGLTTSTVSFTSYARTANANIVEYLECESTGVMTESTGMMADCTFDSPLLSSTLTVVVSVMISFLPVVAIVFSCNPRTCRRGNVGQKALSKKISVLSALGVSASKGVAKTRDTAVWQSETQVIDS